MKKIILMAACCLLSCMGAMAQAQGALCFIGKSEVKYSNITGGKEKDTLMIENDYKNLCSNITIPQEYVERGAGTDDYEFYNLGPFVFLNIPFTGSYASGFTWSMKDEKVKYILDSDTIDAQIKDLEATFTPSTKKISISLTYCAYWDGKPDDLTTFSFTMKDADYTRLTGIAEISAEKSKDQAARKEFIDGKFVIRKGAKQYNVAGIEE